MKTRTPKPTAAFLVSLTQEERLAFRVACLKRGFTMSETLRTLAHFYATDHGLQERVAQAASKRR